MHGLVLFLFDWIRFQSSLFAGPNHLIWQFLILWKFKSKIKLHTFWHILYMIIMYNKAILYLTTYLNLFLNWPFRLQDKTLSNVWRYQWFEIFFFWGERDIFDKGIFFICFFQSFKIYFTIWSILIIKTGFYHSIIWFEEEEVKLKIVFSVFFVEKSKMSHSPCIHQPYYNITKYYSN